MSFLSNVGAIAIFFFLFKLVSSLIRLFLAPAVNWSKYGAKKGHWALVTGSTDGIGKEFALQLAQKGFNIILAARNGVKLTTVKDEISKAAKVEVEAVQVDFSQRDPNCLQSLIDVAKSKGAKLTVLINNVGVSHEHPEYFIEASAQDLDNIMLINMVNTVRLTRALLPAMVDFRNGLILNVGSFSGETPIPLLQVYGATKAFLKHWSKAVAAEVASSGVHVQLLNTYFVVSNLSKRKRSSFLIPSPKDYVQAALRSAGQSVFSTPFSSHALLHSIMQLIPEAVLTMLNLAQMRQVRQAALRKAKKI